ncbi:MAG: aspartate ammonia-lyase [Bacilli bacterium]|nr:aspartate ammonia-lyase [Bacilli bacterium]
MRVRIEKDLIGEKELPLDAYYGIHTLRGKENFGITKKGLNRQMIKGLAVVKKAAAKANADSKILTDKQAKAIILTCDEILNGRLHGQFLTDLIQGGGGISMNMNANEVIANRANEMLGGGRGTYEYIHPLDHVNFGQSSNDVIQTSGKIAAVRMTKKLLVELKKLQNAFLDKKEAYQNVLRIGRTHLKEAVPMTCCQQFQAYAYTVSKNYKRIEQALQGMYELNMGANLIGTGLSTDTKYAKKVVFYINKYTSEEFKISKNLIETTYNLDSFLSMSGAIRSLAVDLSKIASDFRLLDMLKEISLPVIQLSSTLNIQKNNPVIPEVVNQVAYFVYGTDTTIAYAVEAAQLEYNPFQPIILYSLFEALTLIRRCVRTFRESCVEGLTVNKEICFDNLMKSNSIIAAFIPHIGYEKACEVVSIAQNEERAIPEVIVTLKLLDKEKVDNIVHNENLTTPGIKG